MDEALLGGLLSVDEYVARLIKEVDEKENRDAIEQKLKERDAFLKKLENYLKKENRLFTLQTYVGRWRQFTVTRNYQRTKARAAELEGVAEELRAQNAILSRQKKDLQDRLHDASDKRNHVMDVGSLAAQVKELAEQLERERSEKVALQSKLDQAPLMMRRPPLAPVTGGNNIKQVDNVAKLMRDYQMRIQRLEDEVSKEKLKVTQESARRLERESEIANLRRDLEDCKANSLDVQLKLARIEANMDSSDLPAFLRPNLDFPETEKSTSTYLDMSATNSATLNGARKSFFRSHESLSEPVRTSKRPLEALSEHSEPTDEGCAQQ